MTQAVGKIDVAYDDDGTVYIHNPLWRFNLCDSWVKGSLDQETGVISIPTGQYLAWSDKLGYGVQLKWGSSHVVEMGNDQDGNPQYELQYSVDQQAKQICYQLDGDQLYLIGDESDIHAAFPYNYEATSVMAVYSDNQKMDAMELGIMANELPDEVEWTNPELPSIYEVWCDYFDYNGTWVFINFRLPEYDLNGNYLDPENLSYSLYQEWDQIMEFDPEIYPELTERITEIPYQVWSNSDHFYYDYAHVFGPWYEFGTIGLQAHYTVNGEKYSSDVIYHSFSPYVTSLTQLPEDKMVSSIRYYNVMGQEISAPAGLTIQVTTYTDGTTRATKLVR